MNQPHQQITYIDNRKTNLNVSITGLGSRSDVKIHYPHIYNDIRESGKDKSLLQVMTKASPFYHEKAPELSNKNERLNKKKI